MRTRATVLIVLGIVGLAAMGHATLAGDWPQWRGPDRTGICQETGLLKEWPADGPPLVWKATGLGDGYGTVSVVGGRIYVMGTKGRAEHVRCLNVADGKHFWATEIGTEKGSHTGPRSTPTVDGDRIYAISSDGRLACLDADKGKVVWKRDLMAEFNGQHGNWAYAESPLIDGDRLVCTPGGSSATIVCLEKGTGKEIWRSSARDIKGKSGSSSGGGRPGKGGRGGAKPYAQAGYASAVVAELGGVKQYVQFLAGGVVGVSAKDGKLLWHYDEPGTGSNANCSAPIVADGSVFAAAGYGVGGGRAKIVAEGGTFKAEQMYFVKQMQNHHGGMVLVDGHIYGANNTGLVCLEFATGKVKWTSRGVGKGSVLYADGHIYHRGENGEVALVEANPNEYKEKGRFRPAVKSGGEKAWAHPVIAGEKLYLRDWDVLLCYDVKASR